MIGVILLVSGIAASLDALLIVGAILISITLFWFGLKKLRQSKNDKGSLISLSDDDKDNIISNAFGWPVRKGDYTDIQYSDQQKPPQKLSGVSCLTTHPDVRFIVYSYNKSYDTLLQSISKEQLSSITDIRYVTETDGDMFSTMDEQTPSYIVLKTNPIVNQINVSTTNNRDVAQKIHRIITSLCSLNVSCQIECLADFTYSKDNRIVFHKVETITENPNITPQAYYNKLLTSIRKEYHDLYRELYRVSKVSVPQPSASKSSASGNRVFQAAKRELDVSENLDAETDQLLEQV